mgnify:CR=1 FL=1
MNVKKLLISSITILLVQFTEVKAENIGVHEPLDSFIAF